MAAQLVMVGTYQLQCLPGMHPASLQGVHRPWGCLPFLHVLPAENCVRMTGVCIAFIAVGVGLIVQYVNYRTSECVCPETSKSSKQSDGIGMLRPNAKVSGDLSSVTLKHALLGRKDVKKWEAAPGAVDALERCGMHPGEALKLTACYK
ncbi:hypothetical protein MAR_012143 [Mya arenaria]|uniref:Uncharacterized protein n=1 Tax=Mya arenaria TaxID=6604 RepID=A0ABY7FZ56_MYAAR|nr:hypothetical protein MAR_012143 [Mya arenaria]